MEIQLVGGPLDGKCGTIDDEDDGLFVAVNRIVWDSDHPINVNNPQTVVTEDLVYVRRDDDPGMYDWVGGFGDE